MKIILNKISITTFFLLSSLIILPIQSFAATNYYNDIPNYSSSYKSDSTFDAFFLFIMCLYCFFILFIMAAYVFTGIMILDASKRDTKVLPNKITWIALMYFLSYAGLNWCVAIYYYFARKRVMDKIGKY